MKLLQPITFSVECDRVQIDSVIAMITKVQAGGHFIFNHAVAEGFDDGCYLTGLGKKNSYIEVSV